MNINVAGRHQKRSYARLGIEYSTFSQIVGTLRKEMIRDHLKGAPFPSLYRVLVTIVLQHTKLLTPPGKGKLGIRRAKWVSAVRAAPREALFEL